MGLLDLLSKRRRAEARVRSEYIEHSRFRENVLRSFRRNAIEAVLFKSPDAKVLVNHLDRRFLVLLPSAGLLKAGYFADDYYPRLPFFGERDSAEKMHAAVVRFNAEARGCSGVISQEGWPKFKRACAWLPDAEARTFQAKGYAITNNAYLDHLVGGALFLNGKQIAKSTIWDSKPKGYFGEKLFEIADVTDRRPNIQTLSFVTADGSPSRLKFGYEILFDRSVHHLNLNKPDEFTDSILNLRDFLYAIEDFFHPLHSGCEEDKRGYLHKQSENDLDSEERDHRNRGESTYKLAL